uniref:DUF4423 domain-containing protein n=1 Tax=uncultured microorganism TaxID=358574 RepID=F8UGX0_9ZZZZ|nr:hypothetical protein LDC_03681 [uncultured microorganism]
MPNIFEYADYKNFLKDYYNEMKAGNYGFSYQAFAQKCGIKNKGNINDIVHGRRPASKANIIGLAQAIKLNTAETEYFEALAGFNQAKDFRIRDYYYEKLKSVKKVSISKEPLKLREDQYEFYSKPYHGVIRLLIQMYGFEDKKGNYKWLSQSVWPKISIIAARKSVELLKRLGFIKKTNKCSYKVTNSTYTTPPEIQSHALQHFHIKTGLLGVNAITELSRDMRNITSLTIGISRRTYEKFCGEIQAFRRKLLSEAEKDANADSVYQLNFQLFPMSDTEKKAG